MNGNYPDNVTGLEPQICGGPDEEGHCHVCLDEGHEWPLSDTYFMGEYWCVEHFVEHFRDVLETICAEVIVDNRIKDCEFDVSDRVWVTVGNCETLNGLRPDFFFSLERVEREYEKLS